MVSRGDYGCLEVKIHMYTEHQSSPEVSRDDFKCLAVNAGAYAAFSAGGGGVHFKLDRTSCQQSLKYISLYNTGGAPFSTEKRNIFLCT